MKTDERSKLIEDLRKDAKPPYEDLAVTSQILLRAAAYRIEQDLRNLEKLEQERAELRVLNEHQARTIKELRKQAEIRIEYMPPAVESTLRVRSSQTQDDQARYNPEPMTPEEMLQRIRDLLDKHE